MKDNTINYKILIKANACKEALIWYLEKFGLDDVYIQNISNALIKEKQNEWDKWLQARFPIDTPFTYNPNKRIIFVETATEVYMLRNIIEPRASVGTINDFVKFYSVENLPHERLWNGQFSHTDKQEVINSVIREIQKRDEERTSPRNVAKVQLIPSFDLTIRSVEFKSDLAKAISDKYYREDNERTINL